jgi:hypothetical protein
MEFSSSLVTPPATLPRFKRVILSETKDLLFLTLFLAPHR